MSNPNYLSLFAPGQLNALAMVFLNLYEQGISIVGIFWGLWLFPFGMLIIKSKFIPKIIGVFLIIGCFSYLVDSFTSLLFPEYKTIVSPLMIVSLAIGEFSIILWLLIKGVKGK